MFIKKISLLIFCSLTFFGCDSIFNYIFNPPERPQYTITPDSEMVSSLNDTSYFVSKNGQVVGYDAKDWKVEIKYMSDFQLNNFEFPEESKTGEFSGNPYTYANWVDPKLGYTPRRFTVFKFTIYNYTGSKLNFDPQISVLQTDRGDYFNAYAREEKNSKFKSIEEYYSRRKGTTGLDAEIYDTRLGIARRTMHYYGKPVYKGDSRDGLIVFDPIVDQVEKLKVTIKDFILEYDENNDPSKFMDLVFYFKQLPAALEIIEAEEKIAIAADTSQNELKGEFTIAQLKYNVQIARTTYKDPWNPVPMSLPSLQNYAEKNTPLNVSIVHGNMEDKAVQNSQMAVIFGGGAKPEFTSDFAAACADYLSNGKFLFIDNAFISIDWPYNRVMEELIRDIQNRLPGKTEFKRISLDHPVFNIWKKLNLLPKGWDELKEGYESLDFIRGLFYNGKLVAILSTKGYPVLWAEDQASSNYDIESQLKFGLNMIAYVFKNRKQ